MDIDAVAFHPAEPGHLSFGEATDVGVEVVEHLLVGALLQEIAGDVLVLQPVTKQSLGRHPLVEQPLHLVDHPLVQPLSQPDANPLHHLLAGERHTYYYMVHRWHRHMTVGVTEGILLDFECPHQPFAVLGVGMVVQLDQRSQPCDELVVAVGFQRATVVGVDRCVGQLVASHHRLDIEAGAATEYRLTMATEDGLEGSDEVVLELVDVVLVACVVDVDEMIGDVDTVDMVVGQVLARADVHATEHLPRVGADNLALQPIGQLGGEGCLAAGGRSRYRKQKGSLLTGVPLRWFVIAVVAHQSLKVSLPRCLSKS